MPVFDLDVLGGAVRGPIDSAEIRLGALPRHPVAPEISARSYMQDIESHTIVYTRSLLRRARSPIPKVATSSP